MPFKNKDDKNAYQRDYWLKNPQKYKDHLIYCSEKRRQKKNGN
jgi:hypothetical protein